MEVDNEARIALVKGEEYIQFLISAKELKQRQRDVKSEEATHEFQQLMLRFE